MVDSVRLDKPVGQLERVRYEEQLKERGIQDCNDDGRIVVDEIASKRVPGGLTEVKRAAGVDGLLQPSEVGGISIRRGGWETVKNWLGFTRERAATRGVREATEDIRKASEQLDTLRTFQSTREFVQAVEDLNDAAETIREEATRADIGLADRAAAEEMQDALRELGSAVMILNGSQLTPPDGEDSVTMPLWIYEELKQLSSTLEELHSVATETFGLTSFPSLEMSVL